MEINWYYFSKLFQKKVNLIYIKQKSYKLILSKFLTTIINQNKYALNNINNYFKKLTNLTKLTYTIKYIMILIIISVYKLNICKNLVYV